MEIVTIIHYLVTFMLVIWFISLIRQAKKLDTSVSKKPNIPVLSLDYVENVILVYNTNTNQFVCQGNNLEEIENNLKRLKVNKAVLIPHDTQTHTKCYWFLNGKLENESKYR